MGEKDENIAKAIAKLKEHGYKVALLVKYKNIEPYFSQNYY